MEFNIETRKKQLDSLDQFVNSSKDRVQSILDYLDWSAEKITEAHKEMIKCRLDPCHRIPVSNSLKHEQNCSFRKENYHKKDIQLSEPNFIPGSSAFLDDLTKVNVLNNALTLNPQMRTGWRSGEPIPKTSDRLQSTYTSDERLALYDYIIGVTKGPPEVQEFHVALNSHKDNNDDKHLSRLELEAMERDAKRRRAKYRNKSIHTANKNATDVLRELIDSQMELYVDWLKETKMSKKFDTPSSRTDKKNDGRRDIFDKRRSRRRRSRSRSRDSRDRYL